MPLNDKKIISIILEECAEIPERCSGYRDEIVEVISEIIAFERSNRVEATNIQQKISDKCDAAARFLTEALATKPEASK